MSGVYFYELVMNFINLVCFTVYMLNFIPPRIFQKDTCELDPEVFANSTWMQFGITPVTVEEAHQTSQILSYVLYAVIGFKYMVAPIYFSFYSTKMLYDIFLKNYSKCIRVFYISCSPILAVILFPFITMVYLTFPIVYFLLSCYYVNLWFKDRLQEIPEKAIQRILLKASELSIVHSLAAICSVLELLTVTEHSNNEVWNGCGRKEQWQFNTGVVALGFNFIGISLLLTQFPKIGIYPRLFEYVFRIIIKLLISFVHVFVGLGVMGYLLLLGSSNSFKTWYIAILKVLIMTTGEIEFDDLIWKENGDAINDFSMANLFVFFTTLLLSITLMNLIISLSVESLGPMIEKVELWSLEHALFNIVIFQEKDISDKKLSKISKRFRLFFYFNYPLVVDSSEALEEFFGRFHTKQDDTFYNPNIYDDLSASKPRKSRKKSLKATGLDNQFYAIAKSKELARKAQKNISKNSNYIQADLGNLSWFHTVLWWSADAISDRTRINKCRDIVQQGTEFLDDLKLALLVKSKDGASIDRNEITVVVEEAAEK